MIEVSVFFEHIIHLPEFCKGLVSIDIVFIGCCSIILHIITIKAAHVCSKATQFIKAKNKLSFQPTFNSVLSGRSVVTYLVREQLGQNDLISIPVYKQ